MNIKPPLRRGWKLILLPVFIAAFGSCIGVSADIQMRRDGSGTITMEYRYSRSLEAIGRLDGNEKWQVIPTGRADWDRTLARLPGMKLVSFSAREKDNDLVNSVTLEFKNAAALTAFFDASGRRASFNGANQLRVILNEGTSSAINPDLMELMKQASSGYRFRISFSAEGNSTMMVSDGEGGAIVPPADADVVSSGKKVSFDIGTGELLSLREGIGVSFSW
jgi:hypothetical protein